MVENISYGNIDFGKADVKKKKVRLILNPSGNKNANLAAISALNPEKATSIADTQTWSTLIAKASGETVKDNPALLKKSVKREEKGRRKKSQQDRARKRDQNIMERNEKKKKGGLKRPGFEGGIRKKSRK
ncbi:hypothetical protein HK098_000188 [Nowakowskiella sp. JEL0407]|nr:hypothetical protein HK098_000188 [Nowakowskiella sp. JEL0407]